MIVIFSEKLSDTCHIQHLKAPTKNPQYCPMSTNTESLHSTHFSTSELCIRKKRLSVSFNNVFMTKQAHKIHTIIFQTSVHKVHVKCAKAASNMYPTHSNTHNPSPTRTHTQLPNLTFKLLSHVPSKNRQYLQLMCQVPTTIKYFSAPKHEVSIWPQSCEVIHVYRESTPN